MVAIANTHHERHFATQQPHRPESERPQQPPPGTSEIRRPETAQNRAIKETKPLGVALVLSKVNMRSVDPILPLKIQNSGREFD